MTRLQTTNINFGSSGQGIPLNAKFTTLLDSVCRCIWRTLHGLMDVGVIVEVRNTFNGTWVTAFMAIYLEKPTGRIHKHRALVNSHQRSHGYILRSSTVVTYNIWTICICSSNIVRHSVWAHDVHGYKQLLCPVMPQRVRPSTYPHYN